MCDIQLIFEEKLCWKHTISDNTTIIFNCNSQLKCKGNYNNRQIDKLTHFKICNIIWQFKKKHKKKNWLIKEIRIFKINKLNIN